MLQNKGRKGSYEKTTFRDHRNYEETGSRIAEAAKGAASCLRH
jgi:hypothetical protein